MTSRDESATSTIAAPAAEPKLDGRRTHIVDRALDYVALAEGGLSAARIARKRRRSPGYVSIALRLGRAIVGMEPGEIAALRSPRITWKLAQRIIRDDADALGIRHQLRAALGGFSTHNVDGRKHRKGRRSTSAAEVPRPIGASWGWDATAFARDPIEFVEAHLRYLDGVQHSVQARATRAVATHSAARVSVGQGIRMLQRSLAGSNSAPALLGSAGTPTERRALQMLEVLARHLADAAAEIASLVEDRNSVRPSDGRSEELRVQSSQRRESASSATGVVRRQHDAALDDALQTDLDD